MPSFVWLRFIIPAFGLRAQDVTGIWQLTHVGEYQGEVVASNILGEDRAAHYEAVPRVTYTDPQAACVGVSEDQFSGTVNPASPPSCPSSPSSSTSSDPAHGAALNVASVIFERCWPGTRVGAGGASRDWA